MSAPGVLFREEQTFSRMFLGVVAAALGAPTGVLALAAVQQVLLGRPWGQHPMSDRALVAATALALAFDAAIALLYLFSRLITEVRPDGCYVRFVPFHFRFRRIPLEQVRRYRAQTYRPIAEYGGWGIRWVPGGKAYNPRGNRGVRFDFTSGQHLLIGSERPEELAGAIAEVMGR